jgi:hypothetical protein
MNTNENNYENGSIHFCARLMKIKIISDLRELRFGTTVIFLDKRLNISYII